MGYKTKFDGSTDRKVQIGGKDKDGNTNPTSIEGYFLGTKTTSGDYGEGKLHIFQTKDGTVGVWGKSRLDNLLTVELVGQMVLVTFTGMIAPTKKGRRPAYGYKVQHDEDNTIDTGGINLNSAVKSEDDAEEEESDLLDANYDEVVATTPVHMPRKPATTPSLAQQNRVKELLSKART